MRERASGVRLIVSVVGGLYVGVAGVSVAMWAETFVGMAIPSGRSLGWLAARLMDFLPVMLWLVAGIAVAFWVAYVFRPRSLVARLAAAAGLMGSVAWIGLHTWSWSSGPPSLLSRPDIILPLGGLASALLVVLLPTPRAWRGASPHPQHATRTVFWVLPGLVIVCSYLPVLWLNFGPRPESPRIAALSIPLPPNAQAQRVDQRAGTKALSFTVEERYPSTSQAQFYARYFASQGWIRDQAGQWEDRGGYEWHGGHSGGRAKQHYGETWKSPDGQLQAILSLRYESPLGTDPHLPLSQWREEWLSVQHVSLLVMAAPHR